MELHDAKDVKRLMLQVLKKVSFPHIDSNRIFCMRSYKSKSRARARIWSFPTIWQKALKIPSHYVIEVVSQNYDTLSDDNKIRVIIHELMHIPKTFSGALRPHKGRHVKINTRTVEKLFKEYKRKKR